MQTGTMTVDNVGNADAIIADCDCDELEIFEQAQAGTTNYNVYAPNLANASVQVPAGAKFAFHGRFSAGVIVGYVEAVTPGSYTFAKVHRRNHR